MSEKRIEKRLKELGLALPEPPKPVASYVPYVMSGKLLFISGQVPMGPDGLEYQGVVGDSLSVEDGQAAARLCALNILAQAKAATRNLDLISRVVRLGGFVRCHGAFTEQPKVINGASDLMQDVFGETGRHARAAVGVNALPGGVAVEVEAVFEVS
ncbi:MAG: RidA family protein [Alphaproteobacteria bacterium]|nr:RidA family protein [Alphaproteobacteria bacterium]